MNISPLRISIIRRAFAGALCLLPFNGIANEPANGDKSVIRGEISQPSTIPGNWRWETSQLPPLAEILQNAKPNPNIYGLYTWAGEYHQFRDSIREIGWKAIRCSGPLDDKAMRAFAEDGVEVMYTLCTPPQKAGASLDEDNAFVEDYAKQITRLVARYGPAGTFFKESSNVPNQPLLNLEIWNEPNFQYLVPPDKRSPEELEPMREQLYAKLLPAAYKAVKTVSPKINVIGFATGGASAADLKFIENTHKDNPTIARSYDVLSTHPYVEPAPPEEHLIEKWGSYGVASNLSKIHDIQSKYGNVKTPIWYTELGWPVSQKDGGVFEMKGTQVTPELQAAYVCRNYAYAQRLGVSRVHVMHAVDTDNYNAGFFLRNGEWRPSASAVKTMIGLMPAPKLVEVVSDGTDGYFAYRFSPAPEKPTCLVLMLWNVAGPKIVKLPWNEANVTVIDMLGHAKQYSVSGHELKLEIGPLPLYLQTKR